MGVSANPVYHGPLRYPRLSLPFHKLAQEVVNPAPISLDSLVWVSLGSHLEITWRWETNDDGAPLFHAWIRAYDVGWFGFGFGTSMTVRRAQLRNGPFRLTIVYTLRAPTCSCATRAPTVLLDWVSSTRTQRVPAFFLVRLLQLQPQPNAWRKQNTCVRIRARAAEDEAYGGVNSVTLLSANVRSAHVCRHADHHHMHMHASCA
jgi:hypothetical protein